jgi:hypothetical protein
MQVSKGIGEAFGLMMMSGLNYDCLRHDGTDGIR